MAQTDLLNFSIDRRSERLHRSIETEMSLPSICFKVTFICQSTHKFALRAYTQWLLNQSTKREVCQVLVLLSFTSSQSSPLQFRRFKKYYTLQCFDIELNALPVQSASGFFTNMTLTCNLLLQLQVVEVEVKSQITLLHDEWYVRIQVYNYVPSFTFRPITGSLSKQQDWSSDIVSIHLYGMTAKRNSSV